jgi:ferredoxin-NADP reductase
MSAGDPAVRRYTARVLGHRTLSTTARELTFERLGLTFRAGQLVTVHAPDLLDDRSYTLCCGERDEALSILYRVIPAGRLTPRLAALRPGDTIDFSGPYGEFVLRDPSRPVVFIATGTGIAPARAYRRSFPGLDLTVIHGVRTAEDLFYRAEFAGRPYFPCLSAQDGGAVRGRVTDFCRGWTLPPGADYYLCGANEMFYDMRDLLQKRGIPPDHVFTEAYYYAQD